MVNTIEKLENHVRSIVDGSHERVKPGMPFVFTTACCPGDGVWQGDLRLKIVEEIPKHYKKGKSQKQLVPGHTQGSRHCLDSLDGVVMYYPPNWNKDNYEELDGPVFYLEKENKVVHPVHGPVIIPAGFTIATRYQRQWVKEQEKIRRAAD